jgi:hypothetical protein
MIEWEDLVLETAERFGGTIPHPDTSNAIARVYAHAPQAVTNAIDRIALEYQDGGIRSPWGILKSRVQQIQTTERTTNRANNRDKAIACAEQWVRNAGIHFDRESELIDELYGDRGMLREHQDTRDRILELWRELRPIGEQIEAEHEAFMARHAAQRARADLQPKSTHGIRSEAELKAIAHAKGADTTSLI